MASLGLNELNEPMTVYFTDASLSFNELTNGLFTCQLHLGKKEPQKNQIHILSALKIVWFFLNQT